MLWNRLVVGYHGCDEKLAQDIVCKNRPLKLSENNYDWLGHGIYFWEGSPERAKQWAEEAASKGNSTVKNPGVVGAVIDLGNCLNLVEAEYLELVKGAYDGLKTAYNTIPIPMPRNQGKGSGKRMLDCAVFESLHIARETAFKEKNDEAFAPFDSIRAFFVEGEPLYPDAGIRCMDHVQLCVRNPAKIIGFFLP